jgi:hypothetical protein
VGALAVRRAVAALVRALPALVALAALAPTLQAGSAERTGRLVLRIDPAEAGVEIDGQRVRVGPAPSLALAPGPHVVRVSHPAFEAQEFSVDVVGGTETVVGVRLQLAGRDLVVRSEPDGVDVRLDGVVVGRTVRPAGRAEDPAELRIERVAAGEHVLELDKPCFRGERRELLLAVDLLDPRPRVTDTVRLAGALAALSVRGAPPAAEVLVDGVPFGRLPVERVDVCPGARRIEARALGRTIWLSTERLEDGEVRELSIAPRPNAAWIDAGSCSATLGAWAGSLNRIDVARPAGFDAASAAGWRGPWGPQTDLVLAGDGAGGCWVHSPHLEARVRLTASPDAAELDRPVWVRASFGLLAADAGDPAPHAVVVVVDPAGPAAAAGIAPGDRVVSAGGVEVGGAQALRRVLAAAAEGAPVAVEWQDPGGERRSAGLRAGSTPVIGAGAARGTLAALVRAAWAACDAAPAAGGDPWALANLAWLVSEHGLPERAVELWRRARLGERRGVGRGTVEYLLGRDLARLGRRVEALRAFELASTSQATSVDDAGPALAPAARDRMRELSAPGAE